MSIALYWYLASLGALLQGSTKVVLREFAAHGGRGMFGHDEGLDGLKTAGRAWINREKSVGQRW